MNKIIQAGIITFALVFAANANAWAWMTGAQASAAASSGRGFSVGSFSCGSSSTRSSGSYGRGYSSSTSSVISSSRGSYATPAYSSSIKTASGYTASTSGWNSFFSADPYIPSIQSGASAPSVTPESVFSASGFTPITASSTTLGTTATSIDTTITAGSATDGYLQLSGSAGKDIASQIRSDLTTSSFMKQGAFADSALINSDGTTAQASRANYFAGEAAKAVIPAEEYRSNTAAEYIPASTDSTGVVVCSGASGMNLANGIMRPNISTDGGVDLAHESDWGTSRFIDNPFFGTYTTPQAARQASFKTVSSTNTAATKTLTLGSSYDIPQSVAKDSTYFAGGWYPVLSSYNAAGGTWRNILDDGPTTNTYGLLSQSASTVSDPLKATVTPEQG